MRLSTLLLVVSLFTTTNTLASIIFINEFHYDNTGSDSNEFIEIAGLAGTDLTNWSLELYNGSNGERYSTIALSGVLTDNSNGFGFNSVSAPAIQNGTPDGIALINASGITLQFISYEGSFTAINGSAQGLFSEDIGISENNSTPSGYSLQLTGRGSEYSDFQWQAAASTQGNVNSGQRFNISSIQVSEPGTLGIFLVSLLLLKLKNKQLIFSQLFLN